MGDEDIALSSRQFVERGLKRCKKRGACVSGLGARFGRWQREVESIVFVGLVVVDGKRCFLPNS